MKRKLTGLSQRYVAALRKHLKQGLRAGLQPAARLGRQAAALGLETPELARIHERALITLGMSADKRGMTQRARIFFTEAIIPVVQTHRAVLQSRSDLSRLNAMLGQRTTELAAAQRKSVEASLKKCGEHYSKSLKESRQLPESLRQLTHKILLAQEKERQTISHQLQAEIVQTLPGINVRLPNLKRAARGGASNLTKEIAGPQRLVSQSSQSTSSRVSSTFIRKSRASGPSQGSEAGLR